MAVLTRNEALKHVYYVLNSAQKMIYPKLNMFWQMHLQSEYYQQLQFGVESYEDRWDKKVTEALLIHYIDMWNVPSKGASMRGIIEKQSAKTFSFPGI